MSYTSEPFATNRIKSTTKLRQTTFVKILQQMLELTDIFVN